MMRNYLKIGILIVLVIGMVMMSGCTSSSSTTTRTTSSLSSLVTLSNVDCTRGEYGWMYCKGYVVNSDSRDHSVSGYIDMYDSNKAKFDHLLFFVNVDAGGKTHFDATSTDAENYKTITYNYYIDRVY